MIKYKEIILSIFRIILHNKYLWFFGLFVAFLSNSGVYKSLYGDTGNTLVDDWLKLKETGIFDFGIFTRIIEAAQADFWGLVLRIAVLLSVFALGIFILWLAVVAKGALVYNAAKLSANKKTDFSEGLRKGRDNFWPVFFFKAGEKIVISVFLLLVLLYVLLTSSLAEYGFMMWIYYVVLLFLFFITFLWSLVINYSIASQVINKTRFIDSFFIGFRMLKNNFIASVESGIVIFIVNFILSFAALILIAAIAIPFVFLMFLFYRISFISGLNFTLFSGAVLLFIIIATMGGVLSAIIEIFWTTIFLILSKTKPKSRIGSILKRDK